MAKSKSKKMRIKLEREGRRNPELERGSWNGINPVTKKTATLKDKLNKTKHKKRWNDSSKEDCFT